MASTISQQQPTGLHAPYPVKLVAVDNGNSSRQNGEVPHDVYADFYYYLDPGDGTLPEPLNVTKPSSYLEKPKDIRTMLVHDLRGQEDHFSLDKNGFQIHRHISKEKDFLETEPIEKRYLPEVEQLVKDM